MNLFNDAVGELQQIEGDVKGDGSALTVDQRLQETQILALLSISQELSAIRSTLQSLADHRR